MGPMVWEILQAGFEMDDQVSTIHLNGYIGGTKRLTLGNFWSFYQSGAAVWNRSLPTICLFALSPFNIGWDYVWANGADAKPW